MKEWCILDNWKEILNEDPTLWLLEEENPSVRYFTLKDIICSEDDDRELVDARKKIMQTGMVPEMLKMQRDEDYIKGYHRFYTNKYRGLVWSLIVLAELGAEINDQIKEQCEYLLNNSQEILEGGFSQNHAAKTGGGRISEVIPCLTGNMVWGLIRFGFPLMYQTDVLEILDILTELGIKDPRMDEAIDLVISCQDEMGRWRIRNTYNNDRLLIPFGKNGEQSKWLTLRAMRILKRYFSQ